MGRSALLFGDSQRLGWPRCASAVSLALELACQMSELVSGGQDAKRCRISVNNAKSFLPVFLNWHIYHFINILNLGHLHLSQLRSTGASFFPLHSKKLCLFFDNLLHRNVLHHDLFITGCSSETRKAKPSSLNFLLRRHASDLSPIFGPWGRVAPAPE